MDQPTRNLTDTITGIVRNIDRSARDLLNLACDVAAKSGLTENDAHQVVQDTFQRTPSSWTPNTSREYQPSFSSQR